jgi:hypothetical protein
VTIAPTPRTPKEWRGDTNSAKRMFKNVLNWTNNEWGGKPTKLGSSLYHAVLSEQALTLLFLQDEDVPDARVRQLLGDLRELIDAEVERVFG